MIVSAIRKSCSKIVAKSNSLTFFILIFFTSNVTNGTNYYIDSVAGLDANNGTTIATPWKSVSKVNTKTLVASDKIYLKCGSVWNGEQLKFLGSGSSANPIIVDQYGTGVKPILNGNGLTTANQGVVYLYNQDYIEINNLEITNYPLTSESIANPNSIFFVGLFELGANPYGADRRGVMVAIKDKGVCNHIYLKNLNIHHIKGQLGNGQLTVNGAIPKRTGGIYFAVLNEATASNSRFNDVLIDNCAINYCENTGLAFDNEDNVYYPGGLELASWTARKFTNIKVSNNVIHHIGKNAMIIRCTDETGLIEYNTCYETALGTTGNTMFSARAKGTVFQYNEGYFNRSTTQNVDPGSIDGSMYDPDYGSVGVIFQYSYSHDNSEGIYWGCNTRGSNNNTSGIPDPEDVGCTLRYCISQNDMGDLIFFNYPSAGNEIYNNIFYIKSGLSSKIIHESGTKNHSYNFFNNIIFDAGNATYAWGSGAGVQTRNFKNNVFFGIPVPTEINDNLIVTSNPLFVNPGTGSSGTGILSINSLDGYKLKLGSPALANGKVVSTNGGKDYFGNSVSSSANPNRGAFEGLGFFPYFYSKNASDLSNISSWGLNATDGSGTPPQNFIADNQGFIIRDVSSRLDANWTVSGTNSILKIGYDATAAKLEIPNTKTFQIGANSSMIVSPFSSISCAIGGTLNFNDRPVTLQSNAFGTATVGQINGIISNATNVTVERYIPSRRAWRALTAPVSTQTSIFTNWQEGGNGNGTSGINVWMPNAATDSGLTAGGSSTSLLEYNSSGNSWSGITTTNETGSMMNGTKNKPFMAFVTGSYGTNTITSNSAATTLRAKGTLLTGTQSYSTLANKYSFIGNPYASPLSLSEMLNDFSNIAFNKNIWIWDANTTTANPVGIYNLFDSNSNTYTNLTSTLDATTQIQSGQAFFVKSTASGTFVIKETHKGSVFSNTVFRDAAPAQLLRVGLYKQINTEWSGRDGAMTVFLADADANQTPNKMANGSENVAFTKNGLLFASEHHLPLVASDVLNVRVWNTTAGANYKLKINTEHFTTTSLNATLEDLFTNSRTPLTLDGTAVEYPFTVTTEAASTGNRFRIVFENSALGINNPKATGISILPNPITGDAFQVNFGTLEMGTYTYSICNTLGQEVEKGNINNVAQNTNSVVKFKNNTAAGMYIMKVTGTDNTVFTKKLIKQ